MTALVMAAVSARMLAEAARDDGFEVVALDLFGDADTRRACAEWLPIGRAERLHIDAELLLAALAALAKRGNVAGWIAGSGFEGRPDLLERGAALLPLIGTPAHAVRRVRDPQTFFGVLDAEGIAHPEVRMTAPADPAGWLSKDAHGCGGWHIRRVTAHHAEPLFAPAGAEADLDADADAHAHRYFQREMQGTPMSATFIANGSDACVLGFNRLIVRRFDARSFVYCGVVGPVGLPEETASRITAAVRVLAPEFSLRGLGSLDFMLDGDAFGVLEINPRPPASIALYGRTPAGALDAAWQPIAAHVCACLQGELPQSTARGSDGFTNSPVRGTEIVFAARPLQLDAPAAQRLAARPACHDLPFGAMHFQAGDPICSVSASGADAGQVHALLARGREAVHRSLETCP